MVRSYIYSQSSTYITAFTHSFHIHLTTHYFKKMFTFGLNYMIDLNIIVIFHRNYHIIVLHLQFFIYLFTYLHLYSFILNETYKKNNFLYA